MRAARRWSALAILCCLAVSGCTRLKDVEVINDCNQEVSVRIWETPTPGSDPNDRPTTLVVGPRSRAVAKDAVYDNNGDGSSAEIVTGPNTGRVIPIRHGGDLVATIPFGLC